VLLAVMNDGAMSKLVSGTSVNLGVDLSVAVGPYGTGAQGATTNNLGADIVAFSDQKGLFGGVAAKFGVITPRQEWNVAYYGQGTTLQAIVSGQVRNPAARPLVAALASAQAMSGSSTPQK
jgi:lipid-binding SYLF domain-containing protein